MFLSFWARPQAGPRTKKEEGNVIKTLLAVDSSSPGLYRLRMLIFSPGGCSVTAAAGSTGGARGAEGPYN